LYFELNSGVGDSYGVQLLILRRRTQGRRILLYSVANVVRSQGRLPPRLLHRVLLQKYASLRSSIPPVFHSSKVTAIVPLSPLHNQPPLDPPLLPYHHRKPLQFLIFPLFFDSLDIFAFHSFSNPRTARSVPFPLVCARSSCTTTRRAQESQTGKRLPPRDRLPQCPPLNVALVSSGRSTPLVYS
jgi:hypothetical protein